MIPVATQPAPLLPYRGGQAQVTLHGADGSTWSLSDGADGALLTEGPAGLGLPTWDVATDESALPGARYRGQRTQVRQLTLPILLSGDPLTWYDLDAAWWAALSGLSTLEITRGQVTSRMLDLRLESGSSDDMTMDPGRYGQQQYSVKLAAYQPFYRGLPLISDVTYLPGLDRGSFWGGAYGGPYTRRVFADFAGMSLTNPGDIAAWIEWQVFGPCDGVDLGVDDRRVIYNSRIDAGQVVTFVSSPESRAVTLTDGTSAYGSLIQQDWAPVAAGAQALLSPAPLNPGNGCRVIATLVPRWRRPW